MIEARVTATNDEPSVRIVVRCSVELAPAVEKVLESALPRIVAAAGGQQEMALGS